jgi:MazG family protein
MSPTTDAAAAFARLVDLVRVLRSPGGCPWDRGQTLQSLRPFVLEETYEVLEALDHDDRRALREEIGDFLFEGVLLAQLCTETGDFTVADSLHAVADKLVRRHPHVFGPTDAAGGQDPRPLPTTPDEVVERWEDLKAREQSSKGDRRTALGGVPTVLPALLRTHEIGIRASAVGFDWERAADVVAKIEEEVAELRAEVEGGAPASPERAEEEMGDLLFAIANLSRKLGIEPESALRRANDKFSRRFSAMEGRLREGGRSLADCSLQEMEDEWARVKQAEGEARAASAEASGSAR